MVRLSLEEIRLTERAHYSMQLSGYFSELVDLRGARFAFTNRFTDTWYNQAYDIDWSDRDLATLGTFLEEVCQSRDRALCVYTSPATKPQNVAAALEEQGLVPFEDEAWLFFPLDTKEVVPDNVSEDIDIREVVRLKI